MMQPEALILRNYTCETSASLARWIAERMSERRHGQLYVEPNEDFFQPSRWYEQLKEIVDSGVPIIALLSPSLNDPADVDDPTQFPGIALLSELLYIAERHPDRARVIPILIDCTLQDLKRPAGEYEQLQDIAAPFVAKLEPIMVESAAFFADARTRANFADQLAGRIQ